MTAILEICTFPKLYIVHIMRFSTQNWPLELSEIKQKQQFLQKTQLTLQLKGQYLLSHL